MENRDGVKSVHFDSANEVDSIELSTGRQVSRSGPINLWALLILLAYPAIGFFIPWASVRVLAWVVGGFLAQRLRGCRARFVKFVKFVSRPNAKLCSAKRTNQKDTRPCPALLSPIECYLQ